jgi:hypothetical protein
MTTDHRLLYDVDPKDMKNRVCILVALVLLSQSILLPPLTSEMAAVRVAAPASLYNSGSEPVILDESMY